MNSVDKKVLCGKMHIYFFMHSVGYLDIEFYDEAITIPVILMIAVFGVVLFAAIDIKVPRVIHCNRNRCVGSDLNGCLKCGNDLYVLEFFLIGFG